MKLPDLQQWDALDEQEREQIARSLHQLLPPPFDYISLETHQMGDQCHQIAFYAFAGARFALIPGGEITLGYDRDHPFTPNPEQQADWATNDENFFDSLENFLNSNMTALRDVSIKPFLIEVTAQELNVLPIALKDPDVEPYVLRLLGPDQHSPRFRVIKEELELRIDRDANGYISAHMALPVTEHIIADHMNGLCRLPTSDEWEYSCSAGTRTMFRWGNDCPMDYDPSIVELGLRLEPQYQPNAFGLVIAYDASKPEFCQVNIIRGGDGGDLYGNGAGRFACWLQTAPAYIDHHFPAKFVRFARRVYPLPSEITSHAKLAISKAT